MKKIIVLLLCFIAVFAVACTGSGNDQCKVTVYETEDGKTTYTYELKLDKGSELTMKNVEEAYREVFKLDDSYIRDGLFTDKDCTTRFTQNKADKDIVLYIARYAFGTPKVEFVYNGNVYSVYRKQGTALSASDFSKSAYGKGADTDYVFFSDSEHKNSLDIGSVVVGDGAQTMKIYVADAK